MNFAETIKKLWKPFVFIFLIVFLLINWQEIALFFNYRAIYGRLKLAGDSPRYRGLSPVETEKEDSVVIPKIGVEAPIVLAGAGPEGEPSAPYGAGETQNLEKYLKYGVLLFPTSVLPGGEGRTVLLGHSAPAGWPDVNYDRVFTELNELGQGDEIYVYFNKREYIYRVKNKFFLDRGEELPQTLTNSNNVLILLSCWPPGKDQYRIAIEAIETQGIKQ